MSITLTLSKKERDTLKVVLLHALRDWKYEAGGTYGDGEKLDNKKEYKECGEVLRRLVNTLV